MNKEKLIEKIELAIKIFSYPENSELEEEFISLFISNFNGIKCSPYAFDYLKDRNPIFFINLKKIYELSGLKLSPEYKEREDHLITLLEYLAILLEEKIPDEYIKKFFNNYLFWIVEFANKLEKSTNNSYFLQGAKILKEIHYEIFKNS